MKRLYKRSIALLLLLGLCLTFHAQSLQVHAIITMNDGTEFVYDFDENARLSFADDQHLFIDANGEAIQLSLDAIRKISFEETEELPESYGNNIILMPNPARTQFTVSHLEGQQLLRIYALDGRMMDSRLIGDGERIDITSFPAGIYLVRIGNSSHKIIKL